jgi:hypothetical protein
MEFLKIALVKMIRFFKSMAKSLAAKIAETSRSVKEQEFGEWALLQ